MKKIMLLICIGMGMLISCAKHPKNEYYPAQTVVHDTVVYIQNAPDTVKPIFGLDALNYVTKTTQSRSTEKLIVLMSTIGQMTNKTKSVDEIKLEWIEKSDELLPVITIKNLKLK